MESGITDEDLQFDANVKIDEAMVNLDYQVIYLLFFPAQKKTFDNVLKTLEDNMGTYVSELKHFEDFKKSAQKVAKEEDVRNVSGIVQKMCEVVNEYYGKPIDETEFNMRVSFKVTKETYESWTEWKERLKKHHGINNESKCFEFALAEALNTPVEGCNEKIYICVAGCRLCLL